MTGETRAAMAALPSYDFKLLAIHSFATSTPAIPSVVAPLGPTCKAFGDNLYRTRSTVLMVSMAIHFSCLIERFHAIAELEINGNLGPEPLDSIHINAPLAARVRALYHDFNVLEEKLRDTPAQTKKIDRRLADALNRLSMISTSPAPQMVSGVNGMLSSLVLGMWTTIETMAGDLWEAALNAHPSGLADLNGYAKRLVKGQKQHGQDSTYQDSKQVPLNQIQRHRYDIKNKMGTILRPKFNFDSLDGIREAYAVAFSEHCDDLDAELKNKSFDSLSVLRNVIVHKGGVADDEYKKKASGLNLLPNVAVGEPIILDGLLVSRLLSAAEMSSIDILRIVDRWITKY